MGRFLFLILACLILRHEAEAVCIGRISGKSLADVSNAIEESPFMVACRDPALLKGRPPTDLGFRQVPEQDQKGRSGREFLKRLLAQVRQRVTESRNQIKNINLCRRDPAYANCEELNHWLREDLPNFVKDARFDLSLSQSERQWVTWFGRASTNPNEDLNSLGSYKLTQWAPLTPSENQRALQQLLDYNEQIQKEVTKRLANGTLNIRDVSNFKSQALVGVRYDHFLKYRRAIAEVPLLQHLTGPEVTNENLDQAFRTMNEGLDREETRLAEFEKQLAAPGPMDPNVLELLRYNSAVEETLLAEPADCGLATSMVYTASNREIGNAIVVGLPILAASMMAPPLAGAVLGGAAGGGLAWMSYREFNETETRVLGHIYGDSLHSELTQLEQGQRQMRSDLILLPTGLGLGGLAVKGLTRAMRVIR